MNPTAPLPKLSLAKETLKVLDAESARQVLGASGDLSCWQAPCATVTECVAW